ncbi:MAG: PrpR N-terminal domain-containing protein [Planctomycetaceae bacterium]|nr:PrpR N-terminal domain-containing protein [Planctomycetaceae bacterium]
MAEDILYIAPSVPVAETIQSVLDDQGLLYPVHEATMSDAVDLAVSYITRGTKIVVSFGGTASMLRKTVPARIIEIRYSSFDLTRVVHAAAKQSHRIAIVGFESFIYNARQIESMFPYPLCIRQVHATDEIPPVIQRLGIEDGIEVFVGGSLVVNAARRFGYPGIHIDADRRAIEDAVEESRWVLRLKKRRKNASARHGRSSIP